MAVTSLLSLWLCTGLQGVKGDWYSNPVEAASNAFTTATDHVGSSWNHVKSQTHAVVTAANSNVEGLLGHCTEDDYGEVSKTCPAGAGYQLRPLQVCKEGGCESCCPRVNCLFFECSDGYKLVSNPGEANVSGQEDAYGVCCTPTCATFQCPPGYASLGDLQVPQLSKESCCQMTCEAVYCPAGSEMINPKSSAGDLQVPELSEESCCQLTCESPGISCPSFMKERLNSDRIQMDDERNWRVCCEFSPEAVVDAVEPIAPIICGGLLALIVIEIYLRLAASSPRSLLRCSQIVMVLVYAAIPVLPLLPLSAGGQFSLKSDPRRLLRAAVLLYPGLILTFKACVRAFQVGESERFRTKLAVCSMEFMLPVVARQSTWRYVMTALLKASIATWATVKVASVVDGKLVSVLSDGSGKAFLMSSVELCVVAVTLIANEFLDAVVRMTAAGLVAGKCLGDGARPDDSSDSEPEETYRGFRCSTAFSGAATIGLLKWVVQLADSARSQVKILPGQIAAVVGMVGRLAAVLGLCCCCGDFLCGLVWMAAPTFLLCVALGITPQHMEQAMLAPVVWVALAIGVVVFCFKARACITRAVLWLFLGPFYLLVLIIDAVLNKVLKISTGYLKFYSPTSFAACAVHDVSFCAGADEFNEAIKREEGLELATDYIMHGSDIKVICRTGLALSVVAGAAVAKAFSAEMKYVVAFSFLVADIRIAALLDASFDSLLYCWIQHPQSLSEEKELVAMLEEAKTRAAKLEDGELDEMEEKDEKKKEKIKKLEEGLGEDEEDESTKEDSGESDSGCGSGPE